MKKCVKCGSKKELTHSYQRNRPTCESCRSKPNKRENQAYLAPTTPKQREWTEYALEQNRRLALKYKV